MTDSRQPWTDADVDRALTRFFAAECPPDLRRSSPPVVSRQRRFPSARITAAAAAVTVVAAAWLIMLAPPDLKPATIADIPATPPQEVIVTVTEPGPVEMFATSAGLMQQQTELKVTTVSWVSPDSGDAIEWQIPELAIELIPVAAAAPGEFR